MDSKLTDGVQKRINSHNRRHTPTANELNYCKASTIILVVLFVCGITAFGISSAIWHFYEYFDQNTGSATIIPITKIMPFGSKTNVTTTTVPATTTKPSVCARRIVGFFTEAESSEITQNQLEKLTHAVFAYMEMTWEGDVDFESEKRSRRFANFNDRAKKTKTDLKVMISIGGKDNSNHFASVAVDKPKRTNFISSVASKLKEHNIDGVNLYWENASENEKWKYITLLKDLKQQLQDFGNVNNRHYIISVTIPSVNADHKEMAYDVDQLLEFVDFINVLSMDYDGSRPKKVGPIAPLYSKNNFNVDSTMRYYVCKTGKPEMFNIVVPFFVRLWNNVTETGNNDYKSSQLNRDISKWTLEEEEHKQPSIQWDDVRKSSYVYDQNTKTWMTFETEQSIESKIDYVSKMNLGGVWIWSVDMDSAENSLLNELESDQLCMIEEDKTPKYNFCT